MWTYESVSSGNDYLAHHGILGMKWGVRRYQNKDSTLTGAGRKRYGDSLVESKNDSKKKSKTLSSKNNLIKSELKRQQRHLFTKHAINAGARAVDDYLVRHNYTMNGKPMRVHPAAAKLVNGMLDYKYMKDTFK